MQLNEDREYGCVLERKGEPRIGDCTELDDCKNLENACEKGALRGNFPP